MKGNAQARLAITVDIEDWYHIPSVTGSPFSVYRDIDEFFSSWTERYDYLTEPTGRILRLLSDYHIKATFFVVADVAEHYPGLVESIVSEGHEIACHGLHHRCTIDPETKKPLIEPAAFEEETLRAKQILEKIAGVPVTGYRAPNALVAGWMLDSLESIGFTYDSSVSVNSLYNKTDSALEGVSSTPYFPRQSGLTPGERRALLEFPWAYYGLYGLKVPTSGGPMMRFLSAGMMYKGLQQSLKRGHTVFYFHPIDISPEDFPAIGRGRPLYWIIKGRIVEDRIRYILTRATRSSVPVPMDTLGNIYQECTGGQESGK
jgi:peptidoglycan/xylan/chitin deacetylase (PgdA/CDA1 family)